MKYKYHNTFSQTIDISKCKAYCFNGDNNLATYKYGNRYYCGDCVLQQALIQKDLILKYYTPDDTEFKNPVDSVTALKVLVDRNIIKEIK